MSNLVLQMTDFKVAGKSQPHGTNQIITLARARAIIAANHAAAVSLGYTSALDPDHNFCEYTETVDPPNVTVRQYFVGAGSRFRFGILPSTGQWVQPQATRERPGPLHRSIVPPAVGAATLIFASAGQSNSNGSGRGRFTAQVNSVDGGEGCYCWDNGRGFFTTLSDPMGDGNDGQGYDGGAMTRFGAKAFAGGLAMPHNGFVPNRVIGYSGSEGGTLIEQWAPDTLYMTTSTTTNQLATGSRTFTVATGQQFKFPKGKSYRATSDTNGPFGGFMDGTVISYNNGTGELVLNVFAVGPQLPAGQFFNDWTLKPVNAASCFDRFNSAVTNMANRGIPPRYIFFTHGESAAGSPGTWAESVITAQHWIAGTSAFCSSIGDTLFVVAGFRPTFYLGQTTVCNTRTSSLDAAQIDGAAARGPDSYIGNGKGSFSQRANAWALVNNLVSPGLPIRRGPPLDSISPANHRFDGCHIGDDGLDYHADRLMSAVFG